MNYALIKDGTVINLIYLHPMNADDFPNAVSIDDVPVRIGDTYDGERFLRDNKVVLPLTAITDERIAAIKDQAVAEIEEAVINGTDE